MWGGDAGGTRFSPLRDITRENVDQLEVAWEYHTGDSSELKPGMPPSSFLATPVLHNNTLYFCSGLSRAFAVDAETGQERWVFDSKPTINAVPGPPNAAVWPCGRITVQRRTVTLRGAAHPAGRECFMGTLDGRLVAIDADTGKACPDFGERGAIDLRAGMGNVQDNEMAMTSPPLVINDLVVQGAMVMDNQRVDSPGGVIRAWDARTGELRWAFDPVPPGAPSPQAIGAPEGQRYHFGTPNSWSISSADPAAQSDFCTLWQPGTGFCRRPPETTRF